MTLSVAPLGLGRHFTWGATLPGAPLGLGRHFAWGATEAGALAGKNSSLTTSEGQDKEIVQYK